MKKLDNSRVLALLCVCTLFAAGYAVAKDDPPRVSHDGLELVDHDRHQEIYKKPGADFSQYARVAILECYVAFRKNWERDQNRDRVGLSNRVTQKDMDRIKKSLSDEFLKVFTEELENGGYTVVDTGAEDVLVLRPAIIDLDVTAPDTMSPGMTQTFAASAGQMTLYMELYDSVTSAILGRVIDAEAARDHGTMHVSNRVTNQAEADRILRKWADVLVDKLDAVHGKAKD